MAIDLVLVSVSRCDLLSGNFNVGPMDLVRHQQAGLKESGRCVDEGAFTASWLDDRLELAQPIADDLTTLNCQFDRRLKIAKFNLLRAASFAHSISFSSCDHLRDSKRYHQRSRDRSKEILMNPRPADWQPPKVKL